MKIAVVTNEVDPGVGGRFTFQHALVDALRDAERRTHHQFVFVTRGLTRDAPGSRLHVLRRVVAYLVTRLIELARDMQDRGLGVRLFHVRTGLERLLAAEEIDLVWFSTHYAEDCDRPFIFTVLDLQHLEQPWFPEVSQRGQFESRRRHYERYLPKATRVIVPNEEGLEQVLRHFALTRERVLVLPHPTPQFALDTTNAGRAGRRPTSIGIRMPYLLYPAQFWSHKNHAGALEALAAVNARSEREFQLVCVGSDKGERAHVERLTEELGQREHVLFPGFVAVEELVALYRYAHALLFLSWFGPENIPPLEAFALECPVIQADVPGVRHQVEEAALLVPPDEPETIAYAVMSLNDPRLRTRLVDRGRQLASVRSADHYVRGVIDFLDEFETIRRCWS